MNEHNDGTSGHMTSKLRSISIVSDVDANDGSPTPIDIVFVYDQVAADGLPKSGAQWFVNKASLLAAFRTQMDVLSLEIPPGFALRPPLPKRASGALRAIAYIAHGSEAGQATRMLTEFTRAQIRIQREAIAIKDD